MILTSCGEKHEDKEETQKYELMTLSYSDYESCTEYPASLRGFQDIRIIPRIEGYLQNIYVNEGDPVRKGQILFRLDDASYRAALRIAQANVQQMSALLTKAQLDYDGKQQLHGRKFISEHELVSARSDHNVARANLVAAKAALASASNELSYTVLRSPSGGVIGRIYYRKGDYVSPTIQDGMTVVADNHIIRAYFSMNENTLMDYITQYKTPKLALQMIPELKLRLSNGRLYDRTGRAESISGIVDEKTGAVQVCALFDNTNGILLSGGTAHIVIPSIRKNVIIIPHEATYEILDKKYVYKVVNGKTVATIIEVEPQNNGKEYVITRGLEIEDVIIAKGAGLLKGGEKVK